MRATARRWLNRRLRRYGLELARFGEVSGTALRRRLFGQLAAIHFNPRHIVDVGAHKAAWSRDARDFFPDAAFTLIEPQAELAPELDRFCAESRQARRLIAGAAATDGELVLTITAEDLEGSSFAISAEEAAGRERRLVRTVALDRLLAAPAVRLPRIVKIDAEGFELEVLAGATTLLGVTELFFVEVAFSRGLPGEGSTRPALHEVFAFMRDHGYEPYDITDLIRRPSDGALALGEVAFALREGELRTIGW